MTNQRLNIVRSITRHWPIKRGRGCIARILSRYMTLLPDRASFSFRYGKFKDTCLLPWPRGYLELFLFGEMDLRETIQWRQHLKPGNIVVDGGANMGYWTLTAAKLVGSTGHVFACEPSPATFESLLKNINASQANNVTPLNVALTAEKGQVSINTCENDPIGCQNSMGKSPLCQWTDSFEVSSIRLDNLDAMKNHPPHLIKLDIEGAELSALKGAEHILTRIDPPIVTFEWNVLTAEAQGYHPSEILSYLRSFNYRFFRTKGIKLVRFRPDRTSSSEFPMVWALHKDYRKDL